MGITTINLYRMGNASGPKMENVRIKYPNPDIECHTDVSGCVWVLAGTGGLSVWDIPNPGLRGTSWLIPSGTPYSDRLHLWSDEPGHWLWEPAQDMLLSDFKDDLASISQFARIA
jgi:hypothetical protein